MPPPKYGLPSSSVSEATILVSQPAHKFRCPFMVGRWAASRGVPSADPESAEVARVASIWARVPMVGSAATMVVAIYFLWVAVHVEPVWVKQT